LCESQIPPDNALRAPNAGEIGQREAARIPAYFPQNWAAMIGKRIGKKCVNG